MKAKFIYETIGDVLKGKSEKEIMSSLENSKDLDPDDLLMQSSEKGFLAGVKKALEIGADVHAENDCALCWASKYGYKDIVELLLKNGADVCNDYTLRWASHNGHYDVVKILLKHGADVHAHNDCALQWASEKGQYDVVELLLKNGANVHAENDGALGWASKYGHKDIVELLKKWMNKPIKESIEDILKPKSVEDVVIPEKVKFIIDQSFNIIQQYPNKFTILEDNGLNCDIFDCYYGFKFISVKKGREFILRYGDSESAQLLCLGSEYMDINIDNVDDFLFYFNLYDPLHEAMGDVLKPKSKEEIADNFFKLYGFQLNDELNLVERAFKVIQSSSNYVITSKLGFYYEIYGFQFESIEPIDDLSHHHYGEIAEYVFGFWPEGKENNEYILIFENSGSDIDIKDLENFIRNLNVKHKLEESNIFKPKSEKELELLIPPKVHEFLNDLYKLVDNSKEYEMKSEDMEFFPSNGYGFQFKTIKHIYIQFGLSGAKQIGRFTIAYFPKRKAIYIILENNARELRIHVMEDLKYFLNYIINESLQDILKPKSEEEIKTTFEKEYPVFTEIFYGLFPNNYYDLYIEEENITASFAFKEIDKNGEIHTFLINQLSYYGHTDAPSISYLDKSKGGEDFGGFFMHSKKVYSIEDVRTYVEKIVN